MRRRRNSPPACIEQLERRDCPAVIGVEGSLALEENGGPVTLTVRLSEAQRTPVEVRFLSFGSAKAGADYRISSGGRPLSSSGALTFRPGQTAIPITVSPINDIAREGTESMTFQLVSARGHILADRLATLTFQDDDNYTATLLGPTQITPGQSATYNIQLSSPATKNEVFYVSTRDGSATSKDNDYWPITDLPVTVTAGQSATSFTLPGSKPNTEPEFDEFYRLTVRTRSANFPTISDVGVVIPGIGPEPAPTISIGNASGNEGNAGAQTLAFEVTLSKAFTKAVTVDYVTIDDTAFFSDNDYIPVSGTLTFAPGETRKTISAAVVGDITFEPDETFSIILSSPTNASVVKGIGIGTIINDDSLPPGISVTDVTLTEGNSGTSPATFIVSLGKPLSQPVTVAFATFDSTATVTDSDYIASNGLLTFAPGETQKTISISVIGDTKSEPDETFTLVLSQPTNASIAKGTALATIRNDDTSPPPRSDFYIELAFTATVSPEIQTLARVAANRWQQVIVGDLPDVTVPAATGGTRIIDDLLIGIDVKALSGNTIAQAGFTDIRVGNTGVRANWQPGSSVGNGLPYVGNVTINTAYKDAPGIFSTIIHEIGHVLGFGTLWSNSIGTFSSYVSDIGTANPVYRGPNGSAAVREYNRSFGTTGTSVPLYDKVQQLPYGYDGSYGTHWRDDIFNNNKPGVPLASQYYELMTANYNVLATLPNGQPMPSYLSAVTVGAMQDLGYQVNYTAADNYVRPGAISAVRTTSTSTSRVTTTNLAQSPLSLAFALYQQLAEAKPSDGSGTRGTMLRR